MLADLILGHRPVVAVEWEPYACQVLRERAAEGWFPDLHVWEGDVRLFDPSEYAGKVDCIHAGFPCQDISVAGKQAGVSEGTRSGLYREVLRIADIVRPRYLYLENVAAILSNGLGTVLADLASMGYDSRWICLRASDVGAPHHRDRWWLLSYSRHEQSQRWQYPSQKLQHSRRRKAWRESSPLRSPLSNSNSNEWSASCMAENSEANGRNNAGGLCEMVSDSYGAQRQGVQRKERIETEYSDIGCSSWWGVESNVGRVVNGISNRIHRLKGLGNAQVPLQAAVAWKLLGGE